MAILNIKTESVGEAGVKPRIILIDTNNTLAEVQASGFLNDASRSGYDFAESDMALVSTKTSPNAASTQVSWFEISKSGDNWTLVSNASTIALADGKILVGNASGVATAVDVSGDATIANTGALTIAANAVELSMLATGITPSHVIKFAGQETTAGGAAAEAFTVTGALATDLAFVQVVDDGTANVTVLQAVVTADTLTVTFSANPGNDTVINYQIIRAAA